jgi:hypothetical protein
MQLSLTLDTREKRKSARMTETSLPPAIGMIVNQYCETFLRRSRGCVRITSFISDFYFDEMIDREVQGQKEIECNYKKIHEEEGFVLWSCSLRRDLKGELVEGSFLVLQVGYFIYVITGSPPSFLREGIIYLAKKMYPDMAIAYITAREIYEILENLSRKKEKKFFYTKFVAKKMFGKKFTGLGYAETDPFQEAFQRASNEGLWIDSIRVFSEDQAKIDFRLSRAGYLAYHRGNFEEYYKFVLALIDEYCSKRLKIFEKRGRKETPDRESRPILIQFDSEVFEDKSVRKQLIDVIADYDYCNYAVIHDGNPHVYLNLVDRVDNSTFSLRTYGANALLVAPQVKATKSSLMRFSKHIMDRFREGKIVDFSA